jgi:hypothetical protein
MIKRVLIHTPMLLALIPLFWLYYAIHPKFYNLMLAILSTGIALYFIGKVVRNKSFSLEVESKSIWDKIRFIVLFVADLLLLVYFASILHYGGSAVKDSVARFTYLDYAEGLHYVASRTTHTVVSYTVWNRLNIIESIAIPFALFAVLSNIVYLGITRGWKSIFYRKKFE